MLNTYRILFLNSAATVVVDEFEHRDKRAG
jgi:hypothetical protein